MENRKKVIKKKFIPYLAKRFKHIVKKNLIIASPSIYWRLRYFVLGYPEPELKLIKTFCSKKLCAIDVGANYGMYSYFSSRYFEICYAFEPLPYFKSIYKKGFENKNVKYYQAALSNKIENVVLRSPISDRGFSTINNQNVLKGKVDESDGIENIKLTTSKLDDYNLKSVGFLKIDVEGHEYEVLLGAEETIRNSKPVILVEIEERHCKGSIQKVVLLLGDAGYNCF